MMGGGMGVAELAVVALFAMLAILMIVERVRPVRRFEEVTGWRLKCLAFMPVVIGLSVAIPFLLAGPIEDVRLLPGHQLGLAGGTLVGILASELIVYWVHRMHHRVGVLWRWIHQLHHSAERVDVFGSAYFHPFEIIEGTVVGVLFFNVVLGLAPEAAVLAVLWQAFNGVFQHGNIRTPTWLGYFVQRPEAHAIHHQRGVHDFNYANLPLWDIVFGTFRNPAAWQGDAGFYSGASKQTLRMLLGRDVSSEVPRS
jgi:sterol desaturase/sphingolipid hydroxylase (fatty acid hydroxylase superfamily)